MGYAVKLQSREPEFEYIVDFVSQGANRTNYIFTLPYRYFMHGHTLTAAKTITGNDNDIELYKVPNDASNGLELFKVDSSVNTCKFAASSNCTIIILETKKPIQNITRINVPTSSTALYRISVPSNSIIATCYSNSPSNNFNGAHSACLYSVEYPTTVHSNGSIAGTFYAGGPSMIYCKKSQHVDIVGHTSHEQRLLQLEF